MTKEFGNNKRTVNRNIKMPKERQAGFHPVDCDEWAIAVPARI